MCTWGSSGCCSVLPSAGTQARLQRSTALRKSQVHFTSTSLTAKVSHPSSHETTGDLPGMGACNDVTSAAVGSML